MGNTLVHGTTFPNVFGFAGYRFSITAGKLGQLNGGKVGEYMFNFYYHHPGNDAPASSDKVIKVFVRARVPRKMRKEPRVALAGAASRMDDQATGVKREGSPSPSNHAKKPDVKADEKAEKAKEA